MRNITITVSILFILIYSCKKDIQLEHSSDFELKFSTDTVSFDTIFSGIASTTKYFKVYNTSSNDIEIDKIFLAKNKNSNYNINIDGKPVKSDDNVLLKSKDSLYIFVEVLINTDEDALFVKDSIIFTVSGKHHNIKLLAWGQDVNLIKSSISKNTNWTSKKPYLIYKPILVDTNAVLHIEAGTKIYFHKGSGINVAGRIEIDGNFDNPILLKADRLEKMYDDVPGQWKGISLLEGSRNNIIKHAEIKNALTGIQIDNLEKNDDISLNLHDTKIKHCSYAGIFSKGGKIFATNCLIADCGYFTLALSAVEKSDFYNCTFANYWQNSIRNTSSVLLNNYYVSKNKTIVKNIEHAGFYNCLIYGNKQNEIIIDKYDNSGYINYEFENCLIKYDKNSKLNSENIKNSFNKKPHFVNFEKYQFALDTLSPAIDKASRRIVDIYPEFLNKDLNNVSRISDKAPDIGAYEMQKNN